VVGTLKDGKSRERREESLEKKKTAEFTATINRTELIEGFRETEKRGIGQCRVTMENKPGSGEMPNGSQRGNRRNVLARAENLGWQKVSQIRRTNKGTYHLTVGVGS